MDLFRPFLMVLLDGFYNMPRVVALYRYPVKGLTPEACEELTITGSGRVAGDRVLGFRFANSSTTGHAWSSKHEFIALVNTPELARLHAEFDHRLLRMRIDFEGGTLAEAQLDTTGRCRLAAAVEQIVLRFKDNPLSVCPERRPLQLVGDGSTPCFQDSQSGQITLHSRASMAAVATAVGDSELSERRFRSNIVIDGVEAGAEQQWLGKYLRIGAAEFEVAGRKVRCLATHANPATGQRDRAVLPALLQVFPQPKPTFAVGLMARQARGCVRVGDEIRVINE